MAGEHIVALSNQLFKGWKLTAVLIPSARIKRQLQPAFVVVVNGLKELLWVGDMNEHGHIEFCTFFPDRIEFGIVNLEARAIILMDMQPEILEYLETYGAGFDVLFQLPGCALAKAGTNVAEVNIGEEHHAIGVGAALDDRESASEVVARAPAQIHDEPDVELVHRLHHFCILLGRDRRGMVAVDVNHGKLS